MRPSGWRDDRFCPIYGRPWGPRHCPPKSAEVMSVIDEKAPLVFLSGQSEVPHKKPLTLDEAFDEVFFMRSGEEDWDFIFAGEHWPRHR
jgi:hypothetical protein